jgi:hypothetical protein
MFRFKKLISRSGPIPHNDPPNFKDHKFKRVIPFGENHLWVGNSFSNEYMINAKHMYVRNLGGAILQYIKIYSTVILIPTLIITYLKSYSQDQANYYRKEFTYTSGPLAPSNNDKEISNYIKSALSETYKDPLGRSDYTYYKAHAPFYIDTNRKSYTDEYIERCECYNGNK